MIYPRGKILEFDQHDENGEVTAEFLDWHAGRITASRLNDATQVLKKGGESAKRYALKWKLIAERLSGSVGQGFVSYAMRSGTEREPEARTHYELTNGVMVRQVGMILHPTIEWCGASPDGLVGDDGMIELKNPEMSTHLQWLNSGIVPEEHMPQMQMNLACSGRHWIDFQSRHKDLPERYATFTKRVERDNVMISELEDHVRQLDAEVTSIIDAINSKTVEIVEEQNAIDLPPFISDGEIDDFFGDAQ